MQIVTDQTNEDGSPLIEENLTHDELSERVADGRLEKEVVLYILVQEMAMYVANFWKPEEFEETFGVAVELFADTLHELESDEPFERVH